ncbi:MAG: hypothetical protein AB1757_25680 [Acidobacteriota bacterium]
MNHSATCKSLFIVVILVMSMLLSETIVSGRKNPVQGEAQIIGVWTGESICQVKNSPCKDEHASYRISKGKSAGKVTVDLGKIVNGKVESMVVLDFDYDAKSQTLISTYQHGVWKFTVKGNTLEGTLTTPENIVYRKVSLKKAE